MLVKDLALDCQGARAHTTSEAERVADTEGDGRGQGHGGSDGEDNTRELHFGGVSFCFFGRRFNFCVGRQKRKNWFEWPAPKTKTWKRMGLVV
jgi:hypothetical protein